MNKKVLVTAILFGSLTVSGIMSAQSVYPGQHQGKLKKETVAPLQAESFDLKDVRLYIASVPMPVCLPDVRADI